MGMPYSLKCLACRGKFPWNPVEGMPDDCPLCHAYIGTDRPDDEIVMPAFLSAKTKSNDQLLRDMQSGAQARAEIAAEAAGVPVSEMSELVPSNFNTRRDAEIMAMPVNNAVTQHMDHMNAKGGNFGFANGAGFAAAAGSGAVTHNDKVVGHIEPRAGARTQAKLQRMLGR